ncbi:uncharacterized protein JN550_010469 [Neoarthrinium moseri]|uniref:uncharacterized protein n=1 Tax=Neoarthrinium moseri TaxID=1658444 RepID=UPI001FDD7325|nr:uncharacterized protein JN550_010469 [Neoarthrinium moseri]KAI1862166.1 hypothetical protein JN550_010469 [Neoarthrinium moseri]
MEVRGKKPNFLIVVADDLGFSDTSPYGGEIDTPNLQRLADEGLRMTGFHTAASCSPTRAMLLSGTDAHIAGLGCMAEKIKKSPEIFRGKPGYEGYLNHRVAALPEILQDAGYFTFMSGKWHLGLKKELSPSARGFTKVLSSLPGAGNHYNHEPQLYGIKEKPTAIFKGDGIWMQDDKFINGSRDLPKDFYSSDTFTDYFLQFLEGRTDEQKEQPFLGYLAFTAPHWPLQAPAKVVRKYKGKYDDGPVALRDRRLKSLVERGLVPPNVEAAPLHTLGTTPWEDLTEDERRRSSRTMEVYAAMVDLIDVNIGRVLDHLEQSGELDDTFIVFMSDNGAEGQLLEAIPILAGYTLEDMVKKFYDNSLGNIGNHNSFVWYGPQWAGAATAPARGAKSYTTEGGIHCPCIIRYPPILKAKGTITDEFTTVMDILPTILELAGLERPERVFRGREVVPIRGKSWLQLLSDPSNQEIVVYRPDDIVGWEQLGMAAVRVGNWKALFIPPPRGPGRWELYDLTTDLGEVNDLAGKEPQKLKEMLAHYETYYQETGMFDSYTMFQEAMRQKKLAGASASGSRKRKALDILERENIKPQGSREEEGKDSKTRLDQTTATKGYLDHWPNKLAASRKPPSATPTVPQVQSYQGPGSPVRFFRRRNAGQPDWTSTKARGRLDAALLSDLITDLEYTHAAQHAKGHLRFPDLCLRTAAGPLLQIELEKQHRQHPMPSVTHAESPTLTSGKKRRWDDNAELQMPLYAALDNSTPSGAPAADLPSLYSYTSPTNPGAQDYEVNNDRLVFHRTSPNKGGPVPNSLLGLQRKIRPLPSAKRLRVLDDEENQHYDAAVGAQGWQRALYSSGQADYSTPPISPQMRPVASTERTTSSTVLSPCHICHRKPTKKSDLDSFADCEGCGERTCYVCIRQCQGWDSTTSRTSPGHEAQRQRQQQQQQEAADEALSRSFTMHDVDDAVEDQESHGPRSGTNRERDSGGTSGWNAKGHCSVICSRCCVERGSEGDVVCLGCLAGIEGA